GVEHRRGRRGEIREDVVPGARDLVLVEQVLRGHDRLLGSPPGTTLARNGGGVNGPGHARHPTRSLQAAATGGQAGLRAADDGGGRARLAVAGARPAVGVGPTIDTTHCAMWLWAPTSWNGSQNAG